MCRFIKHFVKLGNCLYMSGLQLQATSFSCFTKSLIKRHIYWWSSNIPLKAYIFPRRLGYISNWCRNKILTAIFPFESSGNCLGTVARKWRHGHVVLPHCILGYYKFLDLDLYLFMIIISHNAVLLNKI